jgi:hypothetical protein
MIEGLTITPRNCLFYVCFLFYSQHVGNFKQHVQNNGTLYAHIYFAKKDTPLNPTSQGFSLDNRVYTRKRKLHRLLPLFRRYVCLANVI